MERLIIALCLGVVAVVVAMIIQRRQTPTTTAAAGEFRVPEHLERTDFARPDAPWLVAVFTSSTCSTCGDVWSKAKVLDSSQVVVQELEETTDAGLHARYDIRAVPIVAIADATGRVRASYMGPVSATHLWAALAELRDPGAAPSGCGESASGPKGHAGSGTSTGSVTPTGTESTVWISGVEDERPET